MTLRSEYSRDPLQILLDRESVTCKGCIHIKIAWTMQLCDLGKKFGKRCKKYIEQGNQMNVVRKIEVTNYVSDPLSEVLDIYVQWTKRDDMGNKHRDREQDDGHFNESYAKADINTAEAVHTIMWEMKEIHRWAINKRCGISSMWRFPNAVFADVLVDAEVEIIARLKRNSASRDYFK